jgi:hypothetical protein
VRTARYPARRASLARARVWAGLGVGFLAMATAAGAYADPTVWTVAGTGVLADTGDGGHATEGAINQPRAVSALPNGGYAWAEPYAHRVRMVDENGIVRTIAGTGEAGFSGDGGRATAAELNFVHSAAPTTDGGLLLADELNNRIRKISASGIITTVAGTGGQGFSGDGGLATNAEINNPRSVVPLPEGGFLIPDTNNHRVRRVSPTGMITTVAGNGVEGFAGDGGPATDARLSAPFAVAPTGDGGFLIADIGNDRIRKVSADGTIATVAGNGVSGFGGDGGPATTASLRHPHNVAALPDGGFLIADTTNERIRRVDPAGVITTLIGDGVRGADGDGGPAASARLSAPKAISVTDRGDLLIADEQNNRIRFVGTVVAPTNLSLPVISGDPVQGRELTASSGVWQGTGPKLSYQWQRCKAICEDVPGAVARSHTPSAADAGAALRIAVTASNPAGDRTAMSLRTATLGSTPSPKPGSPGATPSTPPTGGGAQPGKVTTPGRSTSADAIWLVQAGAAYQRVHEYTLRSRNRRLSDAIGAFGKSSCTAFGAKRVVASWPARGIRIDARTIRVLPVGRNGCTAPALMNVSEIRLANRRWMTRLGLRVGDSLTKLRRLYPRSPFVGGGGSPRNEYYLVWRHELCTGACTPQARRHGVNVPRLTARFQNGKVIALRLPVAAQQQ